MWGKMRKVELLPTRDCETGYAPVGHCVKSSVIVLVPRKRWCAINIAIIYIDYPVLKGWLKMFQSNLVSCFEEVSAFLDINLTVSNLSQMANPFKLYNCYITTMSAYQLAYSFSSPTIIKGKNSLLRPGVLSNSIKPLKCKTYMSSKKEGKKKPQTPSLSEKDLLHIMEPLNCLLCPNVKKRITKKCTKIKST